MQKYKSYLEDGIKNLLKVPYVYGFKYLPNSINHRCCLYYMDKIVSDYVLLQLSFSYDRNYDDTLSSGRYVGIDTLLSFGFGYGDINKINRTIATMMGLFHYGMNLDAYDVEFVLAIKDGNYKVYVIDYDKVNSFDYNFPYVIRRKLTESDYEEKRINDENGLIRLLASSIHYYPHPDYPEYDEWKETYINTARMFDKELLATKVMHQFERYF